MNGMLMECTRRTLDESEIGRHVNVNVNGIMLIGITKCDTETIE